MSAVSDPVRRRRVFFIAGFDPASPRKHHDMFTTESAKQAAITGAHFEIGPLEEHDELVWGWHVAAERSGQSVEIDYQCLRWDDIVRLLWQRQRPRFFLDVWRAFLVYWRRGVLALPSRTVRAHALAPVVVMTAFVFTYTAVVAGVCALGAVAASLAGVNWWIGALPPLLLWLAVVRIWRRVNLLIPVVWLGRAMIFFSAAERGLHVDFEAWQDAFARRLIAAAREPGWDEILIVSHSMGCQLAVRALGQAIRLDPTLGRGETTVSLLTVGQALPFYNLMTDEAVYRRDFKALVEASHIPWVDVAGRSDAGSAGDAHPLTGLGLEYLPDRPICRAPHFRSVLTPATYRRRRWSPIDFHFQYLMATELPGGYDYFEIVTGPRRLPDTGKAAGNIRPQR